MTSLLKGVKKVPLATWYRKGLLSDTIEPEAELGVDKVFPCDLLQAHWVSEMIACCPAWITGAEIVGQSIKFDTTLEGTKPFIFFLRNHSHAYFQQMDMLAVIDRLGETLRFEISYGLRNLMFWNDIRIHTQVDELTHVPSLSEVHGAAECLENKAYDMYGVFFKGHPDLRRVYTDYGFQGHPMRKDFPVTGYTEMRYDDSLRRIVYEPVEMAQEMRKFDYVNPWHSDDPRHHKK